MRTRSVISGLVGGLLAAAAVAAEPVVIDPDVSFAESPHWRDGKLYYLAYGAHRVMVWDGRATAVFWEQAGCGPSGLIETADGAFLVTCYDSNTIVEVGTDGGTLATIDEVADGSAISGPNDFARDAQGGIYVSASGKWDAAAPIEGRVLYIAPDGAIRPVAVADDIHYANGLALSPDGKTLYVSEMMAQRVLRFEVAADGSLGSRFLFARLDDLAAPTEGMDIYMGPDGLKTDAAGNLYIAQFEGGRVLVVDPAGKLLRTLEVPAPYVTNIGFGADETTAYISAATDAFTAPYPSKIFQVENQ